MAYSGFDISGKVCLVTGGTSGIGRPSRWAWPRRGRKSSPARSNAEKVAAMKAELGTAMTPCSSTSTTPPAYAAVMRQHGPPVRPARRGRQRRRRDQARSRRWKCPSEEFRPHRAISI